MSDEEEMTTNHPPAWTLDAVAAGDAPGAVEPHLSACEACAKYVATLREEAAAFRRQAQPAAFAAQIRARVTGQPRRRVPVGVWLAAPALAAAVTLVVWPSRAPTSSTVDTAGSSERFKGGLTMAVVRERAGRQERLTGPFEVEPGDRIRLEIAVDGDRPVAGGLLSSDGSWAPLLSPVPLGRGTHYSELAARFDDTPTDAFVIAGAPADVERARATRNFAGVIAWRVRSAHGR